MTVGVMSVGEITVGVMTVGVMTVGVMRRPRFNMGWQIFVSYPNPESRDKIYQYLPTLVKTQNTLRLP
jgi:hypothetical protein